MNGPVRLQTIYDATMRPPLPLATELSSIYGSFRFPQTSTYIISNFVTILDGAFRWLSPGQSGGGEISGFDKHDRAVMGILRAVK